MGKAVFIKYLLISFVLIEMLEWSLLFWGAPSYLEQSQHRGYVILFTVWSGIIGAPIMALLLFGMKKRKTEKEKPKM
ncbi:hypothetical protein [Ammoniphilus sp. YIM 78166]|uniref:hypothetical protein n=1 Tax=Ammoniphilus sp. YIM 78166 TaxID=1644106 RepID=UPI00106FC9D9|nr:hypothetical protein [Ammoniphilus sp. YIM 78166]